MTEKKVIKKSDWTSSFTLIGKPVINDYTFKLNERSEKSNWVYNAMNLGVDCGENFGTVYCECMGGYSEENENRIYAHGKNDNGTDNYDKQIIVPWEDRFKDEVLEEIGDMSFITVGLERTNKRDVFEKKFLSAYDAIAYVNERLTSDMTVYVRGNLKYSIYNDTVQVRKNITSIKLCIDNKTKEYQKNLQTTKENIDRLREQMEATTNRIESNYYRKQQTQEIAKQEQLEQEYKIKSISAYNELEQKLREKEREFEEYKSNLDLKKQDYQEKLLNFVLDIRP